MAGEKLFAEWRNTVVGWCAPYQRRSEQGDSWVYWLIEARRGSPQQPQNPGADGIGMSRAPLLEGSVVAATAKELRFTHWFS